MMMAATVAPTEVSKHHVEQRQRAKSSSDGSRLMPDADGGMQSSFKRNAADDDDSEEAFLFHTSWMDWSHVAPSHRSRTSLLIGQWTSAVTSSQLASRWITTNCEVGLKPVSGFFFMCRFNANYTSYCILRIHCVVFKNYCILLNITTITFCVCINKFKIFSIN